MRGRLNYLLMLRRNSQKERARARSSTIILTVLMIIMLVSANTAKSFAQNMYNDMKLPNENFVMLSIARSSDPTNTRTPPVFSRADIKALSEKEYIDKISAYSTVSIILPIQCPSKDKEMNYRTSTIRSVDPDFFSLADITFMEGSAFSGNDDEHAVIGYNLALQNDLQVGDTLLITKEHLSQRTVTIVGIMEQLPAQKFSLLLSKFNNSIFINADSNWVRDTTLFNGVYLTTYTADDRAMREYCEDISNYFEYAEFRTQIAPTEIVVAENRLDVWDTTNIWMDYIMLFEAIFGVLLLFVLLFGMVSKVMIMVMDSIEEYKTLSFIGASFYQLVMVVSDKVLSMTVKGGIVGAVLALIIQIVFTHFTGIPFIFDIPIMLISIVASLIVCELSALLVMKHERKNLSINERG